MELSEAAHHAACTAAEKAENAAVGCNSGLESLRKLLESLACAVWGRDVGLGGAQRSTKPIVELVAEATTTAHQACTEEMLNAVKSLATQVRCKHAICPCSATSLVLSSVNEIS